MKKFVPFLLASILMIGLIVYGINGYQRFLKIDPEQVDTISVWVHTVQWKMTSGDVDKFINLYNASKYRGEGTGEGGTPVFVVDVHFVDGSVLNVNDFQALGRDFEVTLLDATGQREVWCYINNQPLLEYLCKMVEPACP